MKNLNEVTLLVGGIEYGGWKSVRIEAGIDRQARSFDLEVTSKWPGNTDIAAHIKQGDVVQVKIGSDLVLTGYVDATPIRYDESSRAAVFSSLVGRHRVLVLHQSGNEDEGSCQDCVLYERAHRAGKALETDYTVAGWREQDGTLWQPNRLVRVRDKAIGFETTLLIVGVAWVIDVNGQRTELKVGPPDGYRSKAKKKGALADRWGDVH